MYNYTRNFGGRDETIVVQKLSGANVFGNTKSVRFCPGPNEKRIMRQEPDDDELRTSPDYKSFGFHCKRPIHIWRKVIIDTRPRRGMCARQN